LDDAIGHYINEAAGLGDAFLTEVLNSLKNTLDKALDRSAQGGQMLA
jgi:hypothetical protein